MVHVIMGEIVASDGVAGHRADESFDHSFRRVTQKKRGHAISAIGANRRELFQILKARRRGAVRAYFKAHPGNEDAIEKAF